MTHQDMPENNNDGPQAPKKRPAKKVKRPNPPGNASPSTNGHLDPDDVRVEAGPVNARDQRKFVFMYNDTIFPDQFNSSSAKARNDAVKKFAKKIGSMPDQLKFMDDLINEAADEADKRADEEQRKAAREREQGDEYDAFARSRQILEKTPEDIRDAAESFLRNPDMFKKLDEDFDTLGIVGEVGLRRTLYIVGSSRLLDKPLGAIVQAASSSGKSFVTNTVLSLFPREQKVTSTVISDQALYYVKPGRLKHCLVSVAERKHGDADRESDVANATLALREMLSSGELVKVVTVNTGAGLETEEIHQEGPIAFLQTTTQETIFDEDATRLLKLVTDESRGQTDRIVKRQAQEAAGLAAKPEQIERIQQTHQAAQRMLKPLHVQIPFADLLSIPSDKVASRRAFPQLLGCIMAVALLRQLQKDQHDGVITADLKDYTIAVNVMCHVLRRSFAQVNDGAMSLLANIREHRENGQMQNYFDRQDCVEWSGLSLTAVSNRLTALEQADLIVRKSEGQGTKATYLLPDIKVEETSVRIPGLPTPKELKQKLDRSREQRKQ